MSVSTSLKDQRLWLLDRTWRREALEETISADGPDVFVGEQIAEEDIVAQATTVAFSAGSYDEVDPEILELAGMSVIQDGLPRGLHIMTRRELRGHSFGYAA